MDSTQSNVNTNNANTSGKKDEKYVAPPGFIAETFSFKETKDKDTQKVIPKPDPVIVDFKPTTLDEIAALLNGTGMPEETTAKVRDLILISLNDVKRTHIKKVLFDDMDLDELRTSHTIDPELYDLVTIALMPPARRGAVGIEDEVWDSFEQDYQEVMQANGVDEKRAKVGANILRNRLNKVKSNLDALKQFELRIGTWYTNTKNGEIMEGVYKYLSDRVQKLIVANEPQTVLQSF